MDQFVEICGMESEIVATFGNEMLQPAYFARNIVAGMLHQAHSQCQLAYNHSMKLDDFYRANALFIGSFVTSLKSDIFDVTPAAVRWGILDFMNRMKFLHTSMY